jgi:hypothetical protein
MPRARMALCKWLVPRGLDFPDEKMGVTFSKTSDIFLGLPAREAARPKQGTALVPNRSL